MILPLAFYRKGMFSSRLLKPTGTKHLEIHLSGIYASSLTVTRENEEEKKKGREVDGGEGNDQEMNGTLKRWKVTDEEDEGKGDKKEEWQGRRQGGIGKGEEKTTRWKIHKKEAEEGNGEDEELWKKLTKELKRKGR